MSFHLSKTSLDRLAGVRLDLVRVVKRAIETTPVDFGVLEGLRSEARQKELVAAGKSTTMHSRHLTGHAVDLVAYKDGKISWEWPLYSQISLAMKAAAAELLIPLEWGGDWKTFKDGPHYQLPWKEYP